MDFDSFLEAFRNGMKTTKDIKGRYVYSLDNIKYNTCVLGCVFVGMLGYITVDKLIEDFEDISGIYIYNSLEGNYPFLRELYKFSDNNELKYYRPDIYRLTTIIEDLYEAFNMSKEDILKWMEMGMKGIEKV